MLRLRPLLRFCPLLIFVVAIYFLVTKIFGSGVLMDDLVSLKMLSGADFAITSGDMLVILGFVLLYFEILKSTKTSADVAVEHVVSLLVFIGCLIALLALEAAGTATFFLITIMTLLDVIAGFTVTIASARRDLSVERGTFG